MKKIIKKYKFFLKDYYIFKIIKRKLQLYIIKKFYNNLRMKNFDFLINYESSLIFYFNISTRNNIALFYEKNLEKKNKVINEADKILEHRFSFLSEKEYCLGEKINWNQDFKSGFIWENKFFKEIKIIDLNNHADVKIPWELSRFQHIFTLGKAYWITDDKRYYEEFKKQLLDWIKDNPVYMTINWTCTMDVAIRSINWIFGYFLFENLIKEDGKFLEIFNNSLYQHGRYIFSNLEKKVRFSSNHYLSDLTGLIFLGLYFKNLNKETKKWLNYSIKELEKEILLENNEDGTNYETSISYHRLVTELLFFSLVLSEKNSLFFSKEYRSRLEKMFEFMAKITKSNGKVPLIGDVDNGRLVILSNYYNWEVNDLKHLISLGGEYFNNQLLKEVASKEIEDKLWLFNSINIYEEKFLDKSVYFRNGGYYLLRNKNIYCLIRCGELSLRGQGGHSHNDQLSFEINIHGEDFFIDPGMGVYTANKNMRNLFRSTKMHNTVSINDLEQNCFNEDKLFEMKEQSYAKCLKFLENEFEGEHYGYLIKGESIHKRKIKLFENEIEIIDDIGKSTGILNLHLDLGIKLYKKENNLILEKNKIKIFINVENVNYKILNSLISKKYGEIKESKKIEIYFKLKNSLKIKII